MAHNVFSRARQDRKTNILLLKSNSDIYIYIKIQYNGYFIPNSKKMKIICIINKKTKIICLIIIKMYVLKKIIYIY